MCIHLYIYIHIYIKTLKLKKGISGLSNDVFTCKT